MRERESHSFEVVGVRIFLPVVHNYLHATQVNGVCLDYQVAVKIPVQLLSWRGVHWPLTSSPFWNLAQQFLLGGVLHRLRAVSTGASGCIANLRLCLCLHLK